jgi:hypothetical protein
MVVRVGHLLAGPAARLQGLLPEDLMDPADLRQLDPAARLQAVRAVALAVLMADSVRRPSH